VIQRRRPPGDAAPTLLTLGLRWVVEAINSWLSNCGQLRRNTDRRSIHHAALCLATTMLIVGKHLTYRDRGSAAVARRSAQVLRVRSVRTEVYASSGGCASCLQSGELPESVCAPRTGRTPSGCSRHVGPPTQSSGSCDHGMITKCGVRRVTRPHEPDETPLLS
jgi:hypothetical protein